MKLKGIVNVRVASILAENGFTEPERHFLISCIVLYLKEFAGLITNFVIPNKYLPYYTRVGRLGSRSSEVEEEKGNPTTGILYDYRYYNDRVFNG